MTITVEIPDDIASSFATNGASPAQAVLEAVALEGYRRETLSEAGVRRLLGLATREEVHGFLKAHGAYMHYTLENAKRDAAVALEVARRYRAHNDATPAESRAE